MIEQLKNQPLWLLFSVIAIGFALERIALIRRTFGIASVLFVGLIFGAIDPELRIPSHLYEFGLVLFVYTIGLSCGPTFFRTFHRSFRNSLLTAAAILLVALLIVGLAFVLRMSSPIAAGFFAGSLTNTPALASLTEHLSRSGSTEAEVAAPIVGYSIAYPMSILAVIIAIRLTTRLFKVDYSSEAKSLVALGAAGEEIKNLTVRVTRSDLSHLPIGVLISGNGWRALLGRRLRDHEESLVHRDTQLEFGDLVSVIGTAEDVEPVVEFLGNIEPDVILGEDRGIYDNRRIFLSNSDLFGRHIRDLKLIEKFEAIITRVRRGDLDYLATADFVLEPGDRVRVVAPKAKMKQISAYFGDSYKALSEIDFVSISLGLLLGFLVGQLPLPAPEGYELKLGIAGGPLIVALLLGWAGRTGPLVWTLPYSANLTLRQIGMVMFLAGVGTRAGNAFVGTFMQGGWQLMLIALVLVFLTVFGVLLVGYKVLKIPMSVMLGIVAGMQTQPALLSYANQQTGNDSPNVGYASVYPLAMILKILIAQAILIGLG